MGNTKIKNNQKGMTLVELLAILVILGIIAAIAVPMIGNVIQESRDKATVNEALSVISAAILADTNNELFGTENLIKVTELISLGYIDADGYDGVTIQKNSTGWIITTNEDIRTAVNNLVNNDSYIAAADYLSEEDLIAALEGKQLNRNKITEIE